MKRFLNWFWYWMLYGDTTASIMTGYALASAIFILLYLGALALVNLVF